MDSIEDLQNKQLSDDNIFIDKQKIDIGKNGESRYVDALHKGWACNRTFLCYFPPPVATKDQVDQAEAAAAVDHDNLEYITMMEIWKETAELYIEDLEFLLNLPYHKFWSQVIYHKGVHDSLLSYLQHAPRCFDVDSEEIIPEEIKDLHSRIHRLVFLVFLRMATHRESKDCRITPSVYGNLIYDNFLFDIPKILDLCAIYGRGNKELLKKMVENIFQNQNCYMGDLKIAVEHINKALSTIEIQLGLRRNEDNSPVGKLSGLKSVEGISRVSSTDLQDVITYTLDTFGTIHSFLEVYPAACSTFLNGGFPVKMAALYDSVVGNVFPELKHRLRKGDSSVEPLKYKLDIARTFMLKIFRLIIDTCFLLPVLEHRKSANSENFESYLTIISTILSEKRFVVDCEAYHPLEDDLDLFNQAGFRSDVERVDYITVGLDSIREEMGREKTRLEKKKTRLIDHVELSLYSKTESKTLGENMDNLNINDSGHSSLQPQGAAAASNAVTGIELSSLISQVKDLLPHLGDGFVQVCLDHYNYDVEKVINAVLEDSLPASLQEFDQSMERFEDVKVVEPITEEYRATTLIGQRKNVFDNDEFDVFSRNDIDLAKVHKGKWNKSESVNSKEMKEVTMKLLEDSPDNLLNVYDDEYDDTYDEQSIAANESTTIDELLERRPFEQPRVLSWRNRRVSSSSSEESANEGENANSVKRDEFVPNPAELREKAEQRRQEKMNRNSFHQHRDVKGAAKGQGQSDTVLRNRSNKEKNKSYVGNHNRRAMADRKRSRGMFPV